MSDVMLLGVLRMPVPYPVDAIWLHQFVDRARQAAERIEADAAELLTLRRWKSTHAPRLEALEGLLHAAQEDAQAGREAVTTMNSERSANSILTGENEQLRNALAELVALYEANDYASPIDEANIRDSSSREEEAWKAAKLALKA